VAILKAPPKQPKNATLQVRVEESIKLNLDQYAELIDGNQSYVVTESLRLLFKKDEEFRRWQLDQTEKNGDHEPMGHRSIAKAS
jgi:predicted transcriptional regulator